MAYFSRKRIFFWLGLFLILGGLTGLGTWYWLTRRPFDAWNLMPNNPVLIVETSDFLTAIQEVQTTRLWQNLENTTYLANTKLRLQNALKILAKEGAFSTFFTDRKITLSLHLTAKEDFAALFFVPLASKKDEELWQRVLKHYQKNPAFQFYRRNYRNQTIQEVTILETKERFSFIIHKGYFIGSYAPLLIEDVVRKIDEGERAFAFIAQSKIDELSKIPPKSDSKASFNLFVNTRQLSEFLKMSVRENLQGFFKPLNYFAEGGFLKMSLQNRQLAWQGYSFTTAKDSAFFLNVFKNQAPQDFSFKNFIPNNTAIFYHLSFSNSNDFFKSWQTYWQKENTQFINNQELIAKNYQVKFTDFYQNIDKELAFCILESVRGDNPDKLLFVRSKSLPNMVNWLNGLGKKIADRQKMPFNVEKYGNYPIGEIKMDEFPAQVFGNLVKGFNHCYYVPLGQQVVFANEARLLKQLIEDIKNEEIWAKSPLHKDLLQNFKSPANFNFALNLSKAWSILYENASSNWQNLMNDYELPLKNLNWLSFQFKPEADYFATRLNINVLGESQADTARTPEGYKNLSQAFFKTEIFTQPFIVKNHQDSTQELLVQDFMNNLYLLNSKGNILWRRNIGAPMRSQPGQIDFYNNQRLQYLFITAGNIQLLDRLGRSVSGFPLRMPDTTYLKTFSVLDLDQNGKPYYATSNDRGRIFLFDNKWNKLAGWRPKSVAYRLATPIQHVKIQGKNYLIVSQENGLVQVFNKEGQSQAGFPIQLSGRLTNPLWIEVSLDAENTLLTALTDNGDLVQFNLLGEIKKQEQLYRPSSKAKFWLCRDKKDKDWLIALTDAGYLSIFSKTGEKLFEQEYEKKSDKWQVQYFNFETNLKIVAATNQSEGQTYLYNLKGDLIAEPFPSTQSVEIQHFSREKRILIFYTHHKKIGSLSLDLP